MATKICFPFFLCQKNKAINESFSRIFLFRANVNMSPQKHGRLFSSFLVVAGGSQRYLQKEFSFSKCKADSTFTFVLVFYSRKLFTNEIRQKKTISVIFLIFDFRFFLNKNFCLNILYAVLTLKLCGFSD